MGRRVFIEQADGWYRKMFSSMGWVPVPDLDKVDLICFTGGEDVHPSFYGHSPLGPVNSYNLERDVRCMFYYRNALARNIPMVGICRGGQFLNVVNGGWMYQDVKGHVKDHKLGISVDDGLIVNRASSTHHQMMHHGPGGNVIGAALRTPGYDHTWYDVEDDSFKQESLSLNIEVIHYSSTRSLCFQPHPEFPGYDELKEAFFITMRETILGY